MKNHLFFSPQGAQQGATLIEVLVSMFILALGVMALLAMQVRTSAGIKEAENMSIVAQATQNLVEGMMTNPQLASNGVETEKSYAAYYMAKCPDNAASAVKTASGVTSRDEIIKIQKNTFCAAIQNIKGVDQIVAKAASDAAANKITVEWIMKTDGTASGVTYSYSQSLDN